MLPLRDNIQARTFCFVNYLLIAACVLAFVAQIYSQETTAATVVEQFGMIPARVMNPDEPVIVREPKRVRTPYGVEVIEEQRPAAPSPIPAWMTLFTCIFLHAGWLHLLGNMWFLYVFGDNVEDRLGHLGYLLFYLGSGVAASLVHLVTNSSSMIPTVGA